MAEQSQPGVVVRVSYPGANARVVADTVAAPIEQQVNGVENMVAMRSQCCDDGSYTLLVTFREATDLDLAMTLVGNRVGLALPMLPDEAKRWGIGTETRPRGVLLIACLSSPDGSRDPLFLRNYARVQLRDKFARLAGVGEPALLGGRKDDLRVVLDAQRLATYGLTVADVARAIATDNVSAQARAREPAAGRPSTEPALTMRLGRLATPEQLAAIVVKTFGDGRAVRLQDVAKVELGVLEPQNEAFRHGKPVVALAVSIHPRGDVRTAEADVAGAVSELRANLPAGLALDADFDFSADLQTPGRPMDATHLLVDLGLPSGTSPEIAVEVRRRCEAGLRTVPEVQDTLSLPKNPFDLFRDGPCLVVRLAPGGSAANDRAETIATVRTQLAKIPGVMVGVRDLSGRSRQPNCRYPIDLIVVGPEEEKLQKFSALLATRMRESQSFVDVWAGSPVAPPGQFDFDIDRAALKRFGVPMADVFDTLRACFGRLAVGDGVRIEDAPQLYLQFGGQGRSPRDDIGRLMVRNDKGDMVPLSQLVAVQTTNTPTVVDRFDLAPAVEITADLAAGAAPAETRTLCETLAAEVRRELGLPGDYRLRWPGVTRP